MKEELRSIRNILAITGAISLVLVPAATAQNPRPIGTIGIVEAGQITINVNPQLGIQREQINFSQGELLRQQSIFDLNLLGSFTGSRAHQPLLPGTQAAYGVGSIATNTQATSVGVSQLFRSGVSVSPTVQLNRNSDNLTRGLGVNEPLVGVQVTLPLMRNRGRAAVAAGEAAANLEVEATVYDLNHTASQLLANVALAYWNYLGAVEVLEVYEQSEERGEQFLENVRALASGDVIPRVQIQDAIANLASRRASRIGAEQSLIQAQQQLAVAMGVDEQELMRIGLPGDPFPEATAEGIVPLDTGYLQQLVEQALGNRADYLSARLRAGQQRVLLAGTKNRLRPQLDLVGQMGYTGIRQGGGIHNYFGPMFLSTAGPNATVGLQYQFPRQNRAALGALAQNEAGIRQQDLQIAFLSRQIASSIVTAAYSLSNTMLQVREAQEAAAAALEGRAGEAERLKQGVGSVLDVLQTEDRFINLTISEISAKVAYASAVANFRYATGTYLDPNRPVQSVDREAFYLPKSR